MKSETRVIYIRVDAGGAIDGSRQATQALERMARAQQQAGESLGRLEASLNRAGGLLKAQLAIMVADFGARLVQMAKGALDAAAGLDELAEQLGTNARALQGMQFAAVSNGVKLEQLETALSTFSQKMGEAAGGSKEMVEALNALGVKNLDVQGKLRPTETLMQEVAAAILKVEDPAKRSAAAVDFFGKAGTRMLPMLGEIAKGTDNMAAAAERAGAMISGDTIMALDKMADRSAKASLKVRALFAELAAPIITAGLERANTMLGEIIGQLERGKASGQGFWATILQDSRAQGRMGGLRLATPEEMAAHRRSELQKELQANKGDPFRSGMIQAELDKFNRQTALDRQASMASEEDWARRFPLPGVGTLPGASTTGVKGAGDAEGDRIAKLRRDTARELAEEMAGAEAAAKGGAKAVAELEVHYKALKAAQDAYGKTADTNKGQVAALTAEIERQITAAEKAKNLKEFSLGTEELEKQNELLAAENALINESVEVRGREIALIKLRQETQAKGLDESNQKEREAIERRHAAITQNERLKGQAEELRKANEIWTAPLKSALESIQRSAADMWDGILEKGKFSMEEFSQLFIRTARRAAAELLALATIRPVINFAIGGLGAAGLVSPSTASALGYPSGGGIGGGFGGGSGLFSTGFMQRPIFGGIDREIANWATYGTPAQNSLGGFTWGQAFGVGGGLLSMGLGAASLFGRGGTGSKIGGAAGMLGGALGIAGSLMPAALGGALGPVGMGIGLLGGLLGGILGGGEAPRLPPISGANAAMNWDPARGGYSFSESTMNGGQSIAGSLQAPAKSMAELYKMAGGVVRAQSVYGVSIWRNERDNTGSTYIIGPNGFSRKWGEGSTEKDIGADAGTAFAAWKTLTEAVDLSSKMKTALEKIAAEARSNNRPFSFDALATTVSEVKTLEDALKNFGKTTVQAKEALDQIDDTFEGLYDTAKKYGFDEKEIDTKKLAEQQRLGDDFKAALDRQFMDPITAALTDIGEERTNLLRNNSALMAIKGYQDESLRIEALYAKKRKEILEQAAQQTNDAIKAKVQSLQELIDRLTYGDLANASPTAAFGGTRATYLATLAQARAGDKSANDRLGGVAEAYATAGRSYFASGPEYAALVEQIKRDLVERQGAAVAGASMSASDKAMVNALINQVAELKQFAKQAEEESRDLRQQMAELVAVMKRAAV
jgi:hypothetical protein